MMVEQESMSLKAWFKTSLSLLIFGETIFIFLVFGNIEFNNSELIDGIINIIAVSTPFLIPLIVISDFYINRPKRQRILSLFIGLFVFTHCCFINYIALVTLAFEVRY
ncbi:MAG: hypothetical protein ACJAVN_000546 [Roseivirga sp.]|jgi:hypothetical protein